MPNLAHGVIVFGQPEQSSIHLGVLTA